MSKIKNDIKCCNCGRKLAEAQLTNGWVNIRCKCGTDNLITATPEKKERGQAEPEKREIMHVLNHIPGENLIGHFDGDKVVLTEYGKRFYNEIK